MIYCPYLCLKLGIKKETAKVTKEEIDEEVDFIKNFLKIYWQLDENGKKVIKYFAKTLAENQE